MVVPGLPVKRPSCHVKGFVRSVVEVGENAQEVACLESARESERAGNTAVHNASFKAKGKGHCYLACFL